MWKTMWITISFPHDFKIMFITIMQIFLSTISQKLVMMLYT